MSTRDNDNSDAGSAQQARIARLVRSAVSAVETRDLSLSDTVARRVTNRARRGPESYADESRLLSLVGEVTRQLVASKAALVENLLRSGPGDDVDVAAGGESEPGVFVGDDEFEAARQQLARLCQFVRGRLQHEEWYLFKRRYLEDASWAELAADAGILDETRAPDQQEARARLVRCCEQLRVDFDLEGADRDPNQPAPRSHSSLETEAHVAGEACPHGSMLTWGLTEQQRRLAARSLPWVRLTPVGATPPALPLKEPLLVNATRSDPYLDWVADAEQGGTPVEPVVMLLENDDDRLPAKLWGYTNGTVTPSDWSRAEELLNCSRLLGSEAVAHCVRLSSVSGEPDAVRTQPATQFQFDDGADPKIVCHLDSCVTCRVAFNGVLEDRLEIWREHAAALAAVSVTEEAEARAAQAAPASETDQPGSLTLPFRTLLDELTRHAAAGSDYVREAARRMLEELSRRASRPAPPQYGLAPYATDSETATSPGGNEGTPGSGMRAGWLESLTQLALIGAADDKKRAVTQFLGKLKEGLPVELSGCSFTVQLDDEAGELVIYSLTEDSGGAESDFVLELKHGASTLVQRASEAGRLRLSLEEIAALPWDGCDSVRIRRC